MASVTKRVGAEVGERWDGATRRVVSGTTNGRNPMQVSEKLLADEEANMNANGRNSRSPRAYWWYRKGDYNPHASRSSWIDLAV